MSLDDELRPEPGGRWPEPLAGRLRPWIEWFGAGRLVAAGLTIVAVVVGGWWLLRPPARPTEAGLPFAGSSTSTAAASAPAPVPATTTATSVIVHVAGAVARPGVYELAGDARVHAAIEAAGGVLPEAAPGSLNLAAVLIDGARVFVPVTGETVPAEPAPTGGDPIASGPLDLNRATADQLDELPGIGPATAQAIVDHRAANGPFASIEDLEAVRGIGPAKLATIRPLVSV